MGYSSADTAAQLAAIQIAAEPVENIEAHNGRARFEPN